jgi:lysyl endopeptidase
VLFVRLNDWAPAGAWLTGWDANPVASNAAITVLHHPSGDLEKYSAGTSGSFTQLPSPNGAPTGFMSVTYNQGTTEGGSSGAGLLTYASGEYFLRGGLWGGYASCSALTSPDYYSRLDVVYPDIRQWLNAQAANQPDFDVTDLWWNAAESGWGLNLAQHPSGQIFGVWYTYAADYGPLWLVLSGGQWTTPRSFTGKLYRTAGPAYNKTFDPTKVTVFEVGTLTLNFTDANNGSFTWVVDGVQGTKVITRQPF